MSETQIQVIKDVIKMTPRLNIECLNSVKVLMEKAIDLEILKIEPTALIESKKTKEKELNEAVSFEEILKREGLTLDDLQD